MKTIKKTIKLYEFQELTEKQKNKLASDYIQARIEMANMDKLHPNTNLYKAVKRAEVMQTPWFVGSIFYYDFNGKKEFKNQIKRFMFDEDLNFYSKEDL
jgi:hypothetical protein